MIEYYIGVSIKMILLCVMIKTHVDFKGLSRGKYQHEWMPWGDVSFPGYSS